jgi:hypothetical protein
MAPSREPSTERRRENNESSTTVRIPEYYADATMAWFRSINATFAVSRITASPQAYSFSWYVQPFLHFLVREPKRAW